jgi:hypothetical protein
VAEDAERDGERDQREQRDDDARMAQDAPDGGGRH